MARGFTRSGRGLPAPKRQIANDGTDIQSGAELIFLATDLKAISNNVGFALAVPAATIVRTRGVFRASVITAGSASTRISGAMGMIVVSENAFTAGILSLPTPLSDTENDWFVWVPFVLHVDATDPSANDVFSDYVVNFDSRGMRKLKQGDVLAIVYEAAQSLAVTGTKLDLSTIFRSQFKL